MVVLMIAGVTYAVLQLAMITTLTRTVSTSTLLLAIAAGGYGCGVLAIVGEVVYTRVLAAVTGDPLFAVVRAAGYSADPVIEELVKLAPMIIIVVGLGRVRRQWSLVDYLLVGAATGAGFGLAEALLRYAGQAAKAIPDRHGGFIVATGLDAPRIGGLPTILTSWLPAPVDTLDLFGISGGGLNFHLSWTALAGLGVGVLVRVAGSHRLLGVIPIAYAGANHVAMNYALRHLGADGVTASVLGTANEVRGVLPVVVLVAVVLAMVHDVMRIRLVRSRHPALLLAAEREAPVRVTALLRMALVAPPWTPLVVLRFVALRRAAWNELASLCGRRACDLAPVVAHLADQLDHAHDRDRWRRAAAGLVEPRRSLKHVVRRWRMLVWLILLLPAVAYLVVGATPATSGLQKVMASEPGLTVVRLASLGAVLFLVGQLIGTGRRLRQGLREPNVEASIQTVLRLVTGAGALVAGVVLVFRSFASPLANGRVIVNFHILDALSVIALVAGLALFLAALIYFPPLALVGLAEGGAIIVVTQAAATSAGMIAGAAALGSLGVLLSEASDAPWPAPAPATRRSGRPKGVRLDPAIEAKVQAKLPKEWGDGRRNKSGVGTRWFPPRAPSREGVRVDRGKPDAHWPSQRVDHVVVRHDGEVIGPDGRGIVGRIDENPQAHIPLTEWLKWRRWWTP